MRFFEAHVHYQDRKLVTHWPAIAAELTGIGLVEAVCNGTSPEDWQAAADLSQKHAWIRPAFGLHPWQVGNVGKGWLNELRQLLLSDPRALVGEIGLDLWMLRAARADDPRLTGLNRAPLEIQEAAFVAQFELAVELKRPPTIHGLDAWDRLVQLLKNARLPAHGFLLHGFSGPSEYVAQFIDAGAFFSFNGNFLSPRHARIRDIFARLPLERILVETDAPAMPLPESHRKYRLPPAPDGSTPNHPANLEVTYSALAEIRGTSTTALADAIESNFYRLFGGNRDIGNA